MKKLILTGCAATLFAIGSIAQVQDTVSNDLRQGVQETQEDAKEAGNEFQRQTEQTGQEIKQDAQEAGNEVKQDAQEAGQEIKQEAQDAGNQIQQGAERAGEEMEQGAEKAQDRMQMERQPDQQNPSDNATGMNTMPPQTEIEVLEDKEGPNNAVVYKYQGGLYYVDRETKQLVEIEESQLKDAQHNAIEHNATTSDNEQKKQ